MEKLNILIFASHSGSNMQSIIDFAKKNDTNYEVKCLITNNSKAFVIERAKSENIPYFHLSNITHPDRQDFINAIKKIIDEYNINLIALAGYMKLLPTEIIDYVNGRVLNIHPALLPKYGGDGMYGMNVHKAVIENKEKESGATVHLVNSEYDKGKILAQQKINVEPYDTPETLAEKVLFIEHKLYPETIHKISTGEILI